MRNLKISVPFLTVVFLLATLAMGVHADARPVSPAEPFDLESIRADLSKIDAHISTGEFSEASTLVGKDIKARDIYYQYLQKASGISESLLRIRKKIEFNDRTLTLQQLGALTQRLSAENMHFRDSFTHGQEKFQTYQLIEKAIHNLEDAINYWRVSNQYRFLYRGSVMEQAEDDEILKIKIQTAMNAIAELETIMQTREALGKDLEEGT